MHNTLIMRDSSTCKYVCLRKWDSGDGGLMLYCSSFLSLVRIMANKGDHFKEPFRIKAYVPEVDDIDFDLGHKDPSDFVGVPDWRAEYAEKSLGRNI